MSEPLPAGGDAERLDDALYVVHAGRGTGGLGRLLYAVYLVAIFAGIYGFTIWRGLLASADPRRVAHAVHSPWAALALCVAVAGLAVAAWRLGRVRGPVVPLLPFVDNVVAAPLDRALVLRERLALTLIGGCSLGLLLGVIVSGAVAGAGAGGPVTVLAGALIGLVSGTVTATAWFSGQAGRQPGALATLARSGLAGPRQVFGRALRGIRLEDLRRHAVRTTHVGGAVLAGDLRAARLDVAAPVTRARDQRLCPGGRYLTIVRRDLLGLRRARGQLATGGLLTVIGTALAAVSVTRQDAPLILAIIAAAVAYFGFGAFAEGVRLVADNAGTTVLLGLGFRVEALAHLVAPLACFSTLAVPGGSLVALCLGGAMRPAASAVVVMAGLLCGATLMAAFRGRPPDSSFVPEVGPLAMTYWYARPLTLAATSAGLLLDRVADGGAPAALALVVGAGSAGVLIGYGLYLARKLELGHRV